jgi:hypothetical protein
VKPYDRFWEYVKEMASAIELSKDNVCYPAVHPCHIFISSDSQRFLGTNRVSL